MIELSVVIPTYRRPELLSRCLGSILEQTLQKRRFEVIVCDDAAEIEASEAVDAVIHRFSRLGLNIRRLAVRGRHGPAAARNRGWETAEGGLVAFTDDDTRPDAGWLMRGLTAARERDWVAAWGKIIVPLGPRPTDYEKDAAQLASAGFVTANCFCKRFALETIGGFDERFKEAWREDSDLHFRFLKRFGTESVAHLPDAIVVHPVRPASWGVSLKQVKKARFNALLYKKHPDLYRSRVQRIPPLRYYLMLFCLLFGASSALRGKDLSAYLAIAAWGVLVLEFTLQRLKGTRLDFPHVLEMLTTSALLAPIAVFWRLYGAWRFRVLFF